MQLNQLQMKCKKRNVIPYDDDSVCSRNGDSVFAWDVEDRIGRMLANGNYLCPECGKFKLSFSAIGCWD